MNVPAAPKKAAPSALLLTTLFALVSAALYLFIQTVRLHNIPIINYTQFYEQVESGQIKAVTFSAPQLEECWIQIQNQEGEIQRVLIPPNGAKLEKLLEHGVIINQESAGFSRRLVASLNKFSSVLVSLGLLFILLWNVRGDSDRNGILSLFSPSINLDPVDIPNISFNDVAGCEGAKAEIQELVDFFKDPEIYKRLGAKIPKGVLLSGEPGTGKTLLAKALAGEAGVPFLYYSATELEEMYVGLGAKRVRAIFERARQLAPCIIFLDEIDAIGTNRNYKALSNDNHLQTVNQLLTSMDGFTSHDQVIVIGSTNRPQVLDPALVRPGRFDRKIEMRRPNQIERAEILKIYLSKIQVDPLVRAESLAQGTQGFVGADLSNLVNQATLLAAKAKRERVTQMDFDEAYDRIIMGLCRPASAEPIESKIRTAYHEAGHALTALVLADELDIELYKVTILARGSSLGHTAYRPKFSDTNQKKIGLKAELVTAYGGFAAETLIYGENHVSTGARCDLTLARNIAQHMVAACGFALEPDTAPVAYPDDEAGLLRPGGTSAKSNGNLSEKSLELIDTRVAALLQNAYQLAQSILKANQTILETLKNSLIEKESLTSEAIQALLKEQNLQLLRPGTPEATVMASNLSFT